MGFSLCLVRHGESEANVRHMLSGWMDVDLTDNGRKELLRLRETIVYPESGIYFSSPLRRCLETAHILFPDKPLIVSDDFKEINFRSLEGRILPTKEDIDGYFSGWIEDRPVCDEETLSNVMERAVPAVMKAVRTAMEKGHDSATIVMHSGIMRAAIVALFSLDRHSFSQISVPNGRGFIIQFDDAMSPVSYSSV